MATLCAVRLLDALPPALHPTLTCVGFAVPPVGNAALAAAAQAQGWQHRITNYLLPEDWVPGLLSLFHRQHKGGSSGGGSSVSMSSLDSSDGGTEGSSSQGGSPTTNAWPIRGQAHERVCCGHAPSLRTGQQHSAAAWHAAAAAATAAA